MAGSSHANLGASEFGSFRQSKSWTIGNISHVKPGQVDEIGVG